jgi:hypothetical protein
MWDEGWGEMQESARFCRELEKTASRGALERRSELESGESLEPFL